MAVEALAGPFALVLGITGLSRYDVGMESVRVSQKAVISDGAAKCLVLLRGESAPAGPLSWDLPGGYLDRGEDPMASMVREIREETGLTVNGLRPFDVEAHVNSQGTYWVSVGYHAVSSSTDVKISWEHVDYRWVSLTEFGQLGCRPRLVRFVEKFYAL